MNKTLNAFVEILQSQNTDNQESGHMLAMAMAQDGMTYAEAHEKLHTLKNVLECTESYLKKAAFKELSRDGRAINPSHMMEKY
jgi:hypothetical protein